MFLDTITEDPAYYFSWIFAAGFSICCHEFAHAYTAVWFGDDTPRNHLTLNPLVQMGRTSIFMLFIIGIAWGSVPVNPNAFRVNWKRAMVSFAGPLMNLILCALFGLIFTLSARLGLPDTSLEFFYLGGYVNGALFVLNMLPVPTLDGYSVVSAFNPRLEEIRRVHGPKIFLGFAALIFLTPLFDFIFDTGLFLSTLFISLASLPFS